MIGRVSIGVVSRSAEFRAIADFLTKVEARPTGLLMQGDAGVGKTTLWLAALEQARARGWRVLCARAWEAESVMAYGTVADILGDVPADVLAALPDVQRVAMDRVLLRDVAGQTAYGPARGRGGRAFGRRDPGKGHPGGHRNRRPAMARSVQ